VLPTSSLRAGRTALSVLLAQQQSLAAANQSPDLGVRRLRQANFGDRRHYHGEGDTGQQVWAKDPPLQRTQDPGYKIEGHHNEFLQLEGELHITIRQNALQY